MGAWHRREPDPQRLRPFLQPPEHRETQITRVHANRVRPHHADDAMPMFRLAAKDDWLARRLARPGNVGRALVVYALGGQQQEDLGDVLFRRDPDSLPIPPAVREQLRELQALERKVNRLVERKKAGPPRKARTRPSRGD